METLLDFEIHNVDIWTDTKVLNRQRVVVQDGLVKQLEGMTDQPVQSAKVVIDGSGLVLMPAGVDPQVHMRVPGQLEKESPETLVQAALCGGVAAILTMPNTKPVIDSPEVCELAREQIEPISRATGLKVLLSAAMTRGERGQEPVDFDALAEAGVAAFTDDGVGVVKDELMLKAFEASAKLDRPVLQHAEFPGHGGVLAPGPVQEKLKVSPYPASAEYEMVARDIELLKQVPGARYHVLHVSCERTVELVDEARRQGLGVSCEVTPHHLWFGSEDIQEGNSSFKMNPPLRSRKERDFLQKALQDGRIDFVATDHAPHEAEIKTMNFKTAAYGTLGLETSLRVLLSLVHDGKLSPERLVQVFSSKPAKFLKLDESYGQIKPGLELRAVLIDPNVRTEVGLGNLLGKSKNSCFLGVELYGKVDRLILASKVHRF